MKKYILIIGLLVMSWVNVFGQDEFKENVFTAPIKYGKLNYIVGIKNLNTIELGLARGARSWGWDLFYSNYHIAPELTFNETNPILGTKIGFTSTFILINIGAQFIHYTDFKHSEFAFRPEIGISAFGVIDLIYGYDNILGTKEIETISNQNIALKFTFGENQKETYKILF